MFVMGLLVGPAFGLAGARVASAFQWEARLVNLALSVCLIVLLVIPAVSLELRLGLVMGGFLGILLTSTTLPEHSEKQTQDVPRSS